MTDTTAPDEHPRRIIGRDEVLAILRAHKAELVRRFGVAMVALFGSTARNEDGPDSDVDILVKFSKPPTLHRFFGAGEYLERLLGRKVDLVGEETLHPSARPNAEKDKIHV